MRKIITSVFTLLVMMSCVKYDAIPFDGKVLPRRSGYVNHVTNDWLYFNLRTGEIFNGKKVNEHIKEGEQKDRLDWDLAFCGYAMRTNSGTSGNGQGAATDLGKGNYEKWHSLSQLSKDLEWVVDNDKVLVTMAKKEWPGYAREHGISPNIPWFDPNRGPMRVATNANPVLSKAIRFTGPPHSYIPSFHTYVVRTADGKRFFKLKIVSWYNNAMEIGDSGGEMSYYLDELK